MKKLISVLTLGSLLAFKGFTQPVPVVDPIAAAVTNAAPATTQLGKDFLSWFKDNKAFFENKTVGVEVGALYNKSKGIGAFADVQFPITDQLSAGFAAAYLGGELYDAALSVKLGTTLNIPIIKLPVYAYVESGPGYNLSKSEVIAQSFAGGIIKFNISTRWSATAGLAVGNITDLAGPVYAGGFSFTFKGK